MTNYCTQRKDSLLEAALTGAVDAGLRQHLQNCPGCRAELDALRARRARLDSALPLLAQAAEPSAELHARIMKAAAGQKPGPVRAARRWFALSQRRWAVAVPALAAVALAAALLTPRPHHNRLTEDDIATASQLTGWQSPTSALLQTPGQELLQSTPRLGETYFTISVPTRREKHP